jgi:hypothetical protein
MHINGVPVETRLTVSLALLLALAIVGALGVLVVKYLSRDSDVDGGVFQAIAWAGLVAWLVPMLGIMIATMASVFAERADRHRRLYSWMSYVGGVLALANAAAGPLLETAHTSNRCAYAAQERWTAAEVTANCGAGAS